MRSKPRVKSCDPRINRCRPARGLNCTDHQTAQICEQLQTEKKIRASTLSFAVGISDCLGASRLQEKGPLKTREILAEEFYLLCLIPEKAIP